MIEIKTGKFGQYFYDNRKGRELSLEEIKDQLNKLEINQVEVNQVEVTYKVGERIKINRCTYIICQVEPSKIVIVTIKGVDVGNRYRNPYKVENVNKITEQEMFQISGEHREEITRIKE